jgi:hypothetical protein
MNSIEKRNGLTLSAVNRIISNSAFTKYVFRKLGENLINRHISALREIFGKI